MATKYRSHVLYRSHILYRGTTVAPTAPPVGRRTLQPYLGRRLFSSQCRNLSRMPMRILTATVGRSLSAHQGRTLSHE